MKRDIINHTKIQFPSCSANESYARAVAVAFVSQADPTVQEISEIKTAVSEAVTNAIVHGYRDTVGIVEMSLKLGSDSTLYISVKDKGRGIDNIEQAMTPLFTTAAEEERSGLGFSVMESFMDKLRVRSAPSKGTTVTMQKKLSRREG
ncbi:MAG: anti-sigma F factor [Ruminococcaceae bacterium]|nr:anti-sigma F factor [Oscillospiraceae bacterium]